MGPISSVVQRGLLDDLRGVPAVFKMRLLAFPIITPNSPQTGLLNALRKIADEGFEIFDWIPYYSRNQIPALRDAFVTAAKRFCPTHVWTQVQTPNILPRQTLAQIPGYKMTWGGDCRAETPTWAFDIAPHLDLTLMSNRRDVAELRKKKLKADYLQIGFSPTVFCPEGSIRTVPDIIFLGSNYPNRFSRSTFRANMVKGLRERYGSRFGVYGNGWGQNDPFLTEDQEAAAYRGCKIAVSAEHFLIDGFYSDRVFRAAGSGAFLLGDRTPSFDEHFIDGKEAVSWKDFDELHAKIDYYLDHEDERKAIAAAGCKRVHLTHSWDARMAEMKALMA